MCGIVGMVSQKPVTSRLVEGLRRLEYRGYDSAGIATFAGGQVERRRSVGKLACLEEALEAAPLEGSIGIGHTRWATHGKPTEANAHPHGSARVAVVHNGIIENFSTLKQALAADGVSFESETDSEVIARLLDQAVQGGHAPEQAFQEVLGKLEGAFALGVLFADEPSRLYCARRGSPLAIGRGEKEMFIGSDALALAPFTRYITYLEEGDWAILSESGADIRSDAGEPITRVETLSDAGAALVGKGRHRHFMAKEIAEQPEVMARTLSIYLDPVEGSLKMPASAAGLDFSAINRLTISACGTAYLAGLISRYWFESWARLPVEIDIASELRYRDVPYKDGDGALFISQSGETADTLAALRDAKSAGQAIGVLVNVTESTMAREADSIFPMAAGPEIGVASTKAFTCQLAALAAVAIHAGRVRCTLSAEDEARLVSELLKLPRLVGEVLAKGDALIELSHQLVQASDVLYLGRGVSFPMALEGALKLKEISYIHAEGYAAGELKHGPIALVD
ncbi:MAG: glutamine--fructose-6-phosphate transaminase (isomerizing), partial [Pseudomonadota bacterium]